MIKAILYKSDLIKRIFSFFKIHCHSSTGKDVVLKQENWRICANSVAQCTLSSLTCIKWPLMLNEVPRCLLRKFKLNFWNSKIEKLSLIKYSKNENCLFRYLLQLIFCSWVRVATMKFEKRLLRRLFSDPYLFHNNVVTVLCYRWCKILSK